MISPCIRERGAGGRTALFVLLAVGVLASALGGGCSSSKRRSFNSTSTNTNPATPAQTSSSGQTTTAPVPSSAPAPVGTTTRYPIVLVHGAGGNRLILGAQYWLRVPARLRGLGYELLITDTTPGGADQHAREIRDQIVATYPDPAVKVNIIAHSMGGLDSRALIARHGMGDRVASLTTISTPHRGSPAADAIMSNTPPNVQQTLQPVLTAFGFSWTQLNELTTAHAQGVFNPSTPDDPRVFYQSYGGVADPGGTTGTRLQPILWATWGFVVNPEGPNDGMVSLDSARWGLWRGTIPADHASEVGHFDGAHQFDHVRFYEDVCADLALRGF